MEFILNIKLGNDAMRDGADIVKALRRTIQHLEHITYEGLPNRRETIMDANGNSVGRWYIKGEPDVD